MSDNVKVKEEFKGLEVDVDKFLRSVAEDLVNDIQNTTKVKDAHWTSKRIEKDRYKVYNNGNYRLDHLLENGHLVKLKGGKPHGGKQKTKSNPIIHKAYESAKSKMDSHKEEITCKSK